MIDSSFLDQLSRFSLVVNKRVTSTLTGPRKSIMSGRGSTFKDYRIYAPGDDIRMIDWKVFARTDNYFIKVQEEEKNLVVHTLIDKSSSMDFGKPVTKFDYASMIGLGFSYLAVRENEKFQFATFADTLDVFQPKSFRVYKPPIQFLTSHLLLVSIYVCMFSSFLLQLEESISNQF